MAAKFIVLALAVASASANICVPCFNQQEAVSDVCGSANVAIATPKIVVATPSIGSDIISGSSFVDSDSGALLGGSNGPAASSQSLPVLQAPPVTLRAVESPVIRLPSPPVPGPKVIRHKCYCTKTVVRPQVIQRTITVPRIQRYLKQSYRPIVENVAYQARPLGSDNRGEDIVIGGGDNSVRAVISGSVLSGAPVLSGSIISGTPVVSGSVLSGESTCYEAPAEHIVPTFTAQRCY